MLLVPGALALDRGEGEKVADPLQQDLVVGVLAALDRSHEGLEQLGVDVSASRLEDVVLGEVEDLEGIDVGVDAALDPPCCGGDDVLLAPAEHVEVVVAVAEVLFALAAGDEVVAEPLDELAERGALDDGLPDLACDELRKGFLKLRRTLYDFIHASETAVGS